MTLLGDRRQRVVLRSVRQACSGGSQPHGGGDRRDRGPGGDEGGERQVQPHLPVDVL